MTLYITISTLFIHWLADFVLQTHYQSVNKSKNFWVLWDHCTNYGICMTLGVFIFNTIPLSFYPICFFCAITTLAHLCTDFITSRINTHFWNKGEMHNFFVSVGFDQFLHFVALFATIEFINKSLQL